MLSPMQSHRRYKWWKADLIDVYAVDLKLDEYEEQAVTPGDGECLPNKETRWLRRMFYWMA